MRIFRKILSAKSTGFVESTDGSDRRTGIPWVDPRPGDTSRGTGLGPEITELVAGRWLPLTLFFLRTDFDEVRKVYSEKAHII